MGILIFESAHIYKQNPTPGWGWDFIGASDLTRTGDLLITSEMHYRLCYTSVLAYYIHFLAGCQLFSRVEKDRVFGEK